MRNAQSAEVRAVVDTVQLTYSLLYLSKIASPNIQDERSELLYYVSEDSEPH